MESSKQVYFFSNKKTDGNKSLKELLGGKGANLAEMSSLNLGVPPGFTITTKACLSYQQEKIIPSEVQTEIETNLEELEKVTGKKFGDLENPLLVSVRSGAAVSMPGMMDTILNLGLNETVVEAS